MQLPDGRLIDGCEVFALPREAVAAAVVAAATDLEQVQQPEVMEEEDGDECVICLCEAKAVALLPCRHFCVCSECVRQIERCPVCRATFASWLLIK